MPTDPRTELDSERRQARTAPTWVVTGLAVSIALVGGIGALSGRAAPAQPTAFELRHGRVLSVIGSYSTDVTLAKKVVHRDPKYGNYTSFDTVGTAHVAAEVTDQRGKRFTISGFSIGPASYGGGQPEQAASRAATGDSDQVQAGRVVQGTLRYRRKKRRTPYGVYTDEFLDWKSSARMEHGTTVKLAGTQRIGYGDYGGEFAFDGKSTAAKGVTAALAGGQSKAYVRGLVLSTAGGTLHCDVQWDDERSGTVTFTAPPYLAGKSGKIKVSAGGTYSIGGPSGYTVRLTVRPDGSGTANLGLGKFAVGEGGFQITSD